MNVFVKTAIAPGVLIAALSQTATAQTAKDLAGTWDLVSVTVDQGDKHTDIFGPNPKGLLVLGSDGRFAVLEFRSDLRPFAVNSRAAGTADENKAVVQGSFAYYGTYTVDEAAKSLKYHIDAGTFPNWNGVDQVRPFTLVGDELTYQTPGSLGLGATKAVWKRAR